jgi:hypothetical protein
MSTAGSSHDRKASRSLKGGRATSCKLAKVRRLKVRARDCRALALTRLTHIGHLPADAISSAIVHPFLPILATVSGSRHELPIASDSSSSSSSSSESESDEDDDDDVGEAASAKPLHTARRRLPRPTEAKLRIWSFAAPSVSLSTAELSAAAAQAQPAHEGPVLGQSVEDEKAAMNNALP